MPGTLAFDAATNMISITNALSYTPTIPSTEERTAIIPIAVIETITLDAGLTTISPVFTITMEFYARATNDPSNGAVVGVGLLKFEANVDFCLEISGTEGLFDGKKCGADLPTCDPFPEAGITEMTFESAMCWIFGDDCTVDVGLSGTNFVCSTPVSVSDVFGNPPFEIVPWQGQPAQLDFSQFCSGVAGRRQLQDCPAE